MENVHNYVKGGKFLLATVHAVRVSISVWNPYIELWTLGATDNNVSGTLWADYLPPERNILKFSVLQ